MKWKYYLANDKVCIPIHKIDRVDNDARVYFDNYHSDNTSFPTENVYLYDIINHRVSKHDLALKHLDMDNNGLITVVCKIVDFKEVGQIPPTLIEWIRNSKLEKLGI